MKPTLELTEANFETEVLKSSQPVLVEFATGRALPNLSPIRRENAKPIQ
jgi:thioredoxin-like negative regulator of GroEL